MNAPSPKGARKTGMLTDKVGIPVYARMCIDTVQTATDAFVAIQRDVNINDSALGHTAEWSFTNEGITYTVRAHADASPLH